MKVLTEIKMFSFELKAVFTGNCVRNWIAINNYGLKGTRHYLCRLFSYFIIWLLIVFYAIYAIFLKYYELFKHLNADNHKLWNILIQSDTDVGKSLDRTSNYHSINCFSKQFRFSKLILSIHKFIILNKLPKIDEK